MAQATHAYVTRCECGAINGAVVELPEDPKFTAKETARWIKAGLPVERLDLATVKAAEWCSGECHSSPAAVTQPALLEV